MQSNQTNREIKALLIYWSATGNTEKVARAIQKVTDQEKIKLVVKKVGEAAEENVLQYDLVFMATPSYQFLPPEPVLRWVSQQMKKHIERGDIKLGAPRVPGKTAAIFCTYSGPHTGIREATTAGEYLGQFFEHIGFNVAAKLYVVGEFHGRLEFSTQGPLGDIRGRPNQQDLDEVEKNVGEIIDSIRTIS